MKTFDDQSHPSVKSAKKPDSKRATIYDLARMAGVSPGTVSRVLNNRSNVRNETRERVLNAAQALDLKPQSSVRSKQIAIITEPEYTDRVHGYAATITAHLSFSFSRRNIGVLIPTDPIEQLPNYFLDGVIAVTYCSRTKAMLEGLEKRMPVVYMDKYDVREGQYVVRSDHYNAGCLAAEYFIKRGCQRLGFFSGNLVTEDERLRGYTDTIRGAGMEFDEKLMIRCGPEVNAYAAVARLAKARADALFVPGSSFQVIEFVHILQYVMGMSIPRDISIIGGENEGVSAMLIPPLTTIQEPLKEMADIAVDKITALTEGEKCIENISTIPVSLITRDSVV